MAYNNFNRNYSRSAYSGGGSGYAKRTNYSYAGRPQRQARKKSGCKLKNGWVSRKTGERVDDNLLTGWNKSRSRGFITFIAVPRKERETSNANFEHWVVSVQFATGRKTFTGFYSISRRVLIVPDLQMVANPHAPNGGYFGTFSKRK
ncbi:hypothetical protein CLV51_108100 [Chitinophaga niastensis]|uniref:Uncharacterized protein n=1 Tax=Chitinophaga niastensis TaxID=536980 RepID=A0A2P8HB75_CHINA|nr:hypothetical protein [Chitinophaga niastensis]PSL43411.1 hypothetical protein CLV51_108100 [Chitinophaga niastensis]